MQLEALYSKRPAEKLNICISVKKRHAITIIPKQNLIPTI